MLFWLKKILSLPLVPLSCALLAALAGAILLFTKWRQLGRWLVAAALLVIAVFSHRGVAHLLTDPLEGRHAPIPEAASAAELPAAVAQARAIVVLGSGDIDGFGLSATNQLHSAGMSRLAEALRLLRLLPHAGLVVSGAGGATGPTHAQVLAQAAISLGVDPKRIGRLDIPRDTDDEAQELSRRLAGQPLVLVTSASHMPRAMAMCRKAGLRAYPAPADYLLGNDHAGRQLLSWDVGALDASTRAIHEWVGLLWAWLRGQA